MPAEKALATIGDVHATTRAFAQEVIEQLEKATRYKVNTTWGYDPNPGNTEHHSRDAVDLMCSKAAGEWITDYVWKNRARFGLVHMIHLQRIKSTRVSPGVWRKMEDRGGPTANHMDHVHVLLDPSSAVRPSSKPPRPASSRAKVAPVFPLKRGSYFGPRSRGGNPGYSRYLAQWQKQMSRRGWRIAADGLYGPETAGVARAFQEEKGLEVDALIGPQTWAAAWTAPIT